MSNVNFHTHSLNDWYAGGRIREDFLEGVKNSLTTTAFFFLSNHGIPDKIFDELELSMKKFFDLPDKIRKKYEYPETGRQNGYTSFGVEKGDGANKSDNKHFWQTGDLHEFLFVKEVPEFRRCYIQYFDEMRKLYRRSSL